MQRHHGALTETNERKAILAKPMTGELLIEKLIEDRRRIDHAFAQPPLVDAGERKPLPPRWCLTGWLWRVRRYKRGVGHQRRPQPSDVDEVVAIGAISVQENDQTFRGTTTGLDPWSVDHGSTHTGVIFFFFRAP